MRDVNWGRFRGIVVKIVTMDDDTFQHQLAFTAELKDQCLKSDSVVETLRADKELFTARLMKWVKSYVEEELREEIANGSLYVYADFCCYAVVIQPFPPSRPSWPIFPDRCRDCLSSSELLDYVDNIIHQAQMC